MARSSELRALVVAACTLASACTSAAPAPTGDDSQPIVGGGDSASAHDFAIAMADMTDLGGLACSATLIAPDVVLTARHCVAHRDASVDLTCEADGATWSTTGYSTPYAASHFRFFRSVPLQDPLSAHAKQIFVEGDVEGCGSDVAVILLDRPLDGVPVAKVRATPPRPGEKLTVIGSGNVATTSTEPSTTRLERSGVEVLSLGPVATTSDAGKPKVASQGEFLASAGFCFGDSGGPAVDDQNQVVGIVSRLASPSCEDGPDIYSAPGAHADLLAKALALSVADAGADPSTADADVDADGGAAAVPATTTTTSGCAVSAGRDGSDGRATIDALALVLAVALAPLARRRRAGRGSG